MPILLKNTEVIKKHYLNVHVNVVDTTMLICFCLLVRLLVGLFVYLHLILEMIKIYLQCNENSTFASNCKEGSRIEKYSSTQNKKYKKFRFKKYKNEPFLHKYESNSRNHRF